MQIINVKFLQDNGVQYGHLAHKRHPKFNPYILGKKGGIHIINLNQTLQKLKEAYDFVYKLTSEGGKILYICTKPYVRDIVKREAERSGNFYINYRWLGGMLTNSTTIRQSINKLKDIESIAGKDCDYLGILKKEASKKEKTRKKLDNLFRGIRNMFRLPAAAFIIDIQKEKIALAEVIKSNIPVIAITDTNTNPELANYPVPGNDDSLKTIDLFCQVISAASISGKAVFDKQKEELKSVKKETIEKKTSDEPKRNTTTEIQAKKTTASALSKKTTSAQESKDKQTATAKDKQTATAKDKQTATSALSKKTTSAQESKDKQTATAKDKQTATAKDKQTATSALSKKATSAQESKDKQTATAKDKQTATAKDKQTATAKAKQTAASALSKKATSAQESKDKQTAASALSKKATSAQESKDKQTAASALSKKATSAQESKDKQTAASALSKKATSAQESKDKQTATAKASLKKNTEDK